MRESAGRLVLMLALAGGLAVPVAAADRTAVSGAGAGLARVNLGGAHQPGRDPAPGEPLRVVYPAPEAPSDERNSFPQMILRAALAKSGRRVILEEATVPLPQARAMQELASGKSRLRVMWTMTTAARERLLRPVRIPIDKGLLGWRLALIQTRRHDLFQGVRNAADLAHFVAGQGQGWPDVDVLQGAGLPVVAVDRYANLFVMLGAGRFDYFPRSINEIAEELARNSHFGLEVEPYLLLHYPACAYFFVNKDDTELAEALRVGLERTLADGSFDRLFEQVYAADIARYRLRDRRVIELPNPLAPAEMPFNRAQLWFRPDRR